MNRREFDPSVSSAESYWESFVEQGSDDELFPDSDAESFYTAAVDNIIEEDPEVVARFEEMKLKQQVVEDIYSKPTEFQQRTLMACVKRKDVIAHAQDGTGKKVACAIAVLQRVRASLFDTCQALILVPDNRDIAEIRDKIVGMGQGRKIGVSEFFGGKRKKLEKKLHIGSHIAIGGPEFIYDAMKRKCFKTNSLKMLVLYDSAKLLYGDNGTLVQNIYSRIKQKIQVISFSRMLPAAIRKRLIPYMFRPWHITMQKEELRIPLRQFYSFQKTEADKMKFAYFLAKRAREDKDAQSAIFCNTRREVEKVAEAAKEIIPDLKADGLHCGMKASHQKTIIDQFKESSTDVLVVVDAMAQRNDADSSARLIINYDLPKTPLSYIERVGRKGRSDDTSVVVVNLLSSANISAVKEIQEFYDIKIAPMPANVIDFL